MPIHAVFDKHAARYDQSRRKLIPCFDDFYQIALETIPYAQEKDIDILDLGAGTGLMAGMVAESYPNAKITLLDIADKMLSEARRRLTCYRNEFNFVVSDYAKARSFEKDYDLIISSLSIHHLSAIEKQQVFKKIHSHLKAGGIFINADQVAGETEEIDKTYRRTWLAEVKERGVSDEDLGAALERMKEDNMSTLARQLRWLKEAGFTGVNCWYKYYGFAVYSGRRIPK